MSLVPRAHGIPLSLVAAAACGARRRFSKRAVDESAPLSLPPIELAVSVAVLTWQSS